MEYENAADTAVQEKKQEKTRRGLRLPFVLITVSFVLVEVFSMAFLGCFSEEAVNWWPLVFGTLWSLLLTALLWLLPGKASRIGYGIVYFLAAAYAAVQTGYYLLFREMMWISDFRYASEGSDYFDVLLQYPVGWYLSILGLLSVGVLLVWRFPVRKRHWGKAVTATVVAAASIAGMVFLPEAVFVNDSQIQFARSDYGRAQSARAAYENMFNTHRLYQVCGIYQTAFKDIYTNYIYPITPGYAIAHGSAEKEIDSYLADRPAKQENAMTGIFEGKNVVLVLMESMDDWAIGEHTPTICRMMEEGINFTDFYTPAYGSVRTFNSEFCLNTGSFLSSQGGYAFDYVTNDYRQSLANRLEELGYSAKVYHYNEPGFYSRGVFSPAMGYEEYVSYMDYVEDVKDKALYDDEFLFDNAQVSESFFRDGKKLNFIITRSAHLSYRYNEVVSYWALRKYPQYRGLTGHEEEDCMYLKAKLVDDMFQRLLEELEANGELENTVIVAMTDHYTYGVDDEQLVMDRSGVDDMLLVEKVPCFIWSADGPAVTVDKTLNTADMLPTILNLMGVETPYSYLGQDAFSESYTGYAIFPNGSWVCNGIAYNAAKDAYILMDESKEITDEFVESMHLLVTDYVRINNLILETDYYAGK